MISPKVANSHIKKYSVVLTINHHIKAKQRRVITAAKTFLGMKYNLTASLVLCVGIVVVTRVAVGTELLSGLVATVACAFPTVEVLGTGRFRSL